MNATLFVTLSVLAPGKNYNSLLECWLSQMQQFNVPFAVLMGHNNLFHIDLCRKYGALIIPVKPVYSASSRNPSYIWQGTKAHIFSLTQWSRIVYTDMDFIFYDHPLNCVSLCWAPLCAVVDQYVDREKGYYNAGMMIVEPSIQQYNAFVEALSTASASSLAEQDVLNQNFKAQLLPSRCNVIPGPLDNLSYPNLIHDKLWNVPLDRRPPNCHVTMADKSRLIFETYRNVVWILGSVVVLLMARLGLGSSRFVCRQAECSTILNP